VYAISLPGQKVAPRALVEEAYEEEGEQDGGIEDLLGDSVIGMKSKGGEEAKESDSEGESSSASSSSSSGSSSNTEE